VSDEPRAGWFRPDDIRPTPEAQLDAGLVRALRDVSGLSSSVSDALDALGYRLAVPASRVARVAGGVDGPIVGRIVTLRYVPARRAPMAGEHNGRLAYGTAFEIARPGDVLVISAPHDLAVSVLGGNAMAAGKASGVVAAIADGYVRDVDEIDAVGVPVWAAGVTPVSGRGRLEAVTINGPVEVAGVHVVAGDVAVADGSGIAFIPSEQFEAVANRVLGRG
jgi:regulator of RNase E activity RraA